jgi:dolichol-phosphate mannosyltransferase
MKKKITIVCPVYNEEANINDFYLSFCNIFEKLYNYDFIIIFADNKSTDNSLKLIEDICEKDKRISLLAYSKNFGVMKSIYTAISFVQTDACAIFDSDLQDPPQLLFEFINKWNSGNKVIYGKRKLRTESKILFFFRNAQKKLCFMLQVMLNYARIMLVLCRHYARNYAHFILTLLILSST